LVKYYPLKIAIQLTGRLKSDGKSSRKILQPKLDGKAGIRTDE
jgi:hypothetical protein